MPCRVGRPDSTEEETANFGYAKVSNLLGAFQINNFFWAGDYLVPNFIKIYGQIPDNQLPMAINNVVNVPPILNGTGALDGVYSSFRSLAFPGQTVITQMPENNASYRALLRLMQGLNLPAITVNPTAIMTKIYTMNMKVVSTMFSDGKMRNRYFVGGKQVAQGTYNYIKNNGNYR